MARKKAISPQTLQWMLLVLTLAFIWGHSYMPEANLAAESEGVTRWLAPFLELLVGKDNVTDHLVRKLAHFTEFSALGMQIQLLRKGKGWKELASSAEYGFFAAFLDESIQLLSARGAQISDVWLDTAGVAFGVLAGVLLKKVYHNGY